MKVLGLDAGLLATGYGVVEARRNCFEALEWGVWRTGKIKGVENKLKFFYGELKNLLERWCPEAVALEGIYHFKNPRSAFMLAHVRGVLIVCAADFGAEILEVAPARVKSMLTGSGRASKEQVAYAVGALLKVSDSVPSDASDALAVAISASLEIEGQKRVCGL